MANSGVTRCVPLSCGLETTSESLKKWDNQFGWLGEHSRCREMLFTSFQNFSALRKEAEHLIMYRRQISRLESEVAFLDAKFRKNLELLLQIEPLCSELLREYRQQMEQRMEQLNFEALQLFIKTQLPSATDPDECLENLIRRASNQLDSLRITLELCPTHFRCRVLYKRLAFEIQVLMEKLQDRHVVLYHSLRCKTEIPCLQNTIAFIDRLLHSPKAKQKTGNMVNAANDGKYKQGMGGSRQFVPSSQFFPAPSSGTRQPKLVQSSQQEQYTASLGRQQTGMALNGVDRYTGKVAQKEFHVARSGSQFNRILGDMKRKLSGSDENYCNIQKRPRIQEELVKTDAGFAKSTSNPVFNGGTSSSHNMNVTVSPKPSEMGKVAKPVLSTGIFSKNGNFESSGTDKGDDESWAATVFPLLINWLNSMRKQSVQRTTMMADIKGERR